MKSSSQSRILSLLERRAQEISEIEQKYQEQLKHEYLARALEIRRLPNFWKTCVKLPQILNHHTLPRLFTKKDIEALEYLEDISVDDFVNRHKIRTYKLTFEFSKNPYFTNSAMWVAVSEDVSHSYTVSKINFKPNVNIEMFDEELVNYSPPIHKESFLRIFMGRPEGDENGPVMSQGGFIHDVIDAFRIDLWEDPFRYYEEKAEVSEETSILFM